MRRRWGLGATDRIRAVRVSAKVDYAVRAALELAAAGEGPVKGERIAAAQNIPLKFLENILSELRRAGIVGSQRGAEGGYWLAKAADTVSIADIIRAVEGPLADVHGTPPEKLKFGWPGQAAQGGVGRGPAGLRSVLDEVTLADIVSGDLPPVVAEMTAAKGAWSALTPNVRHRVHARGLLQRLAAEEFGDAEGEVERLAAVEAGVAGAWCSWCRAGPRAPPRRRRGTRLRRRR